MLLRKRKKHMVLGVLDRRNVYATRLEVRKIAAYQLFWEILRNNN